MVAPPQRLPFCFGPDHLQNLQPSSDIQCRRSRLQKQSWGHSLFPFQFELVDGAF
jgi:hypothetical protein